MSGSTRDSDPTIEYVRCILASRDRELARPASARLDAPHYLNMERLAEHTKEQTRKPHEAA